MSPCGEEGVELVVKSVIEDVTWRSQVQVKVNELTDDLERAGAVGFDPAYATNHAIAERCITRAHDLAKTPPKRFSLTPIHRWLSGSDVESAWAALHDAEAALCMILPSVTVAARLADLRAGVSTTLRGDGRAEGYAETLKTIEAQNPASIDSVDRERIRVIKSAIDSTSDAAHRECSRPSSRRIAAGCWPTLSSSAPPRRSCCGSWTTRSTPPPPQPGRATTP